MAQNTTGKRPQMGMRFEKLPADDPLFKAGFIIGMKRSASASTAGKATPLPTRGGSNNSPPEEEKAKE